MVTGLQQANIPQEKVNEFPPSQSPAINRRRARRTSRRNSVRDDLEDFLNGTVNREFGPPRLLHHDELEVDIALALSLALRDSTTNGQHTRLPAPVITDMSYESLVQLENVRCVAPKALVSSLTVFPFSMEQAASLNQTLEVCVICQGDYENGEKLLMLSCHHKFHQACGAEWLLNYSKLCPVCKHDVTETTTGPAPSV